MNTPREQITPERLVEAAVAVLKAVEEYSAEHAGKKIYPTDLLGSPEQPRIMCDFTRFEVEEAASFLVRMGYIDPRPRAGKTR
ncbi:MAG: hypothetical protein HBSAPP03_26060 [Phycisphaerae bacterium]|nr:MAG: hypothetical protein HBSAPP03_26060 [Phycisphaerae bacterium]